MKIIKNLFFLKIMTWISRSPFTTTLTFFSLYQIMKLVKRHKADDEVRMCLLAFQTFM